MVDKPIIQEGLYIRTDGGVIAKIIKKNTTGSITCDRIVSSHAGGWSYGNKTLIELSKIKKIDKKPQYLIEVGDIIKTNNLCGEITKIDFDNNKIWIACCDFETCRFEDIKSIVTKEQFERMEYLIQNEKNN